MKEIKKYLPHAKLCLFVWLWFYVWLSMKRLYYGIYERVAYKVGIKKKNLKHSTVSRIHIIYNIFKRFIGSLIYTLEF